MTQTRTQANTDVKPRHSGGRSRDPAKDCAILDAAHRCFFDNGFARTTMEEVAHVAGVSKVTVYSRFADKGALFEGVVAAQMARMGEALDGESAQDAPLQDRLNAFGVALLTFLFDSDHVAMKRMLAVEFITMPALARRFYEAGPGTCRERLASVLAEYAARGEITLTDPYYGAESLLSVWKGFDDIRLEFGLIDGLPPEVVAEKVRRGTAAFLTMVRKG
ncbi:MAG: TetR/AcrR family transcriptional regulator [Sphingopyxis sp.]|nr:TetR/AcrR family transcriptional regulator [Sphingopyxis sp.]